MYIFWKDATIKKIIEYKVKASKEEEIEITEHGFFAVYVDLNVGNNIFTFTNNGKSKSITITRKNSGALKPDFSLSIHCNSMPVTVNYNNAQGFLTFY